MRNMDKKIPGVVVEEISTGVPSGFYKNMIWCLLLGGLLSSISLYVMMAEMGENGTSAFRIILLAAVTLILCGFSKKKTAIRYWNVICTVIPWGLMLVLSQFHGYWAGAKYWVNVIIYRWNQIHEGGVSLFQTNGGPQEGLAFLLLLTVLMVQICWWIVQRRKLCAAVVFGLAWIFLSLVSGVFHPAVGGALFCAFLGMRLSDQNMNTVHRKLFWFVLGAAVVVVTELMIPNQDILSVTEFREQVKSDIHTWRYGEDSLPEGDMRQSQKLHESSEEMLQVRSEQIKMMYFRGFIGGRYTDGAWREMPDSAYGADNAGILTWLSEHEFNPLTQAADYYELCTEDTAPDANPFQIQATGAATCYLYTPVTMKSVAGIRTAADKDTRMTGKGLHGASSYQGTEFSGSRPAELTVAEDWINDPETEQQKTYCEAEAVYRKFVYETYTQVDEGLTEPLQELFWDSYDAENDGIYSAVNQVRNVLRDTAAYTDTPDAAPEDEDPILWFLEKSKAGNAVQFASTAVEALRVHGIPARYVEGYFLSSDKAAANSGQTISLSGQDAHAWVEIYFDGIGWLPVDVTPGYYYDVVSLQQMISLPEETQNSASWNNPAYSATQVAETARRHRTMEETVRLIRNVALFCLGIVGVLVILFTLGLAIFELHRVAQLHRLRAWMKRATPDERIRRKEIILYQLLSLWGIDASLGWHSEEVDVQIAEQFANIEPGDYLQVSELLEKNMYGGQPLEAFEERTVDVFIQKLYQEDQRISWRNRWRLRYYGLKN